VKETYATDWGPSILYLLPAAPSMALILYRTDRENLVL